MRIVTTAFERPESAEVERSQLGLVYVSKRDGQYLAACW
jgi:hypothetical protein